MTAVLLCGIVIHAHAIITPMFRWRRDSREMPPTMRPRWLATGLVTVVTVFAEDRTGGRSKKTFSGVTPVESIEEPGFLRFWLFGNFVGPFRLGATPRSEIAGLRSSLLAGALQQQYHVAPLL